MTRPALVVSTVAALAGAFVLGRVSAPARAVYRDRIEYKDRIITVQAKAEEQHHEEAHAVDTTTRTRTVYRTGPVQFVERETTRADSTARRDATASATVAASETTHEHVQVTERIVDRTAPAPRFSLGAGVGVPVPGLRAERLKAEAGIRLFSIGHTSWWLATELSTTTAFSSPQLGMSLRGQF